MASEETWRSRHPSMSIHPAPLARTVSDPYAVPAHPHPSLPHAHSHSYGEHYPHPHDYSSAASTAYDTAYLSPVAPSHPSSSGPSGPASAPTQGLSRQRSHEGLRYAQTQGGYDLPYTPPNPGSGAYTYPSPVLSPPGTAEGYYHPHAGPEAYYHPHPHPLPNSYPSPQPFAPADPYNYDPAHPSSSSYNAYDRRADLPPAPPPRPQPQTQPPPLPTPPLSSDPWSNPAPAYQPPQAHASDLGRERENDTALGQRPPPALPGSASHPHKHAPPPVPPKPSFYAHPAAGSTSTSSSSNWSASTPALTRAERDSTTLSDLLERASLSDSSSVAPSDMLPAFSDSLPPGYAASNALYSSNPSLSTASASVPALPLPPSGIISPTGKTPSNAKQKLPRQPLPTAAQLALQAQETADRALALRLAQEEALGGDVDGLWGAGEGGRGGRRRGTEEWEGFDEVAHAPLDGEEGAGGGEDGEGEGGDGAGYGTSGKGKGGMGKEREAAMEREEAEVRRRREQEEADRRFALMLQAEVDGLPPTPPGALAEGDAQAPGGVAHGEERAVDGAAVEAGAAVSTPATPSTATLAATTTTTTAAGTAAEPADVPVDVHVGENVVAEEMDEVARRRRQEEADEALARRMQEEMQAGQEAEERALEARRAGGASAGTAAGAGVSPSPSARPGVLDRAGGGEREGGMEGDRERGRRAQEESDAALARRFQEETEAREKAIQEGRERAARRLEEQAHAQEHGQAEPHEEMTTPTQVRFAPASASASASASGAGAGEMLARAFSSTAASATPPAPVQSVSRATSATARLLPDHPPARPISARQPSPGHPGQTPASQPPAQHPARGLPALDSDGWQVYDPRSFSSDVHSLAGVPGEPPHSGSGDGSGSASDEEGLRRVHTHTAAGPQSAGVGGSRHTELWIRPGVHQVHSDPIQHATGARPSASGSPGTPHLLVPLTQPLDVLPTPTSPADALRPVNSFRPSESVGGDTALGSPGGTSPPPPLYVPVPGPSPATPSSPPAAPPASAPTSHPTMHIPMPASRPMLLPENISFDVHTGNRAAEHGVVPFPTPQPLLTPGVTSPASSPPALSPPVNLALYPQFFFPRTELPARNDVPRTATPPMSPPASLHGPLPAAAPVLSPARSPSFKISPERWVPEIAGESSSAGSSPGVTRASSSASSRSSASVRSHHSFYTAQRASTPASLATAFEHDASLESPDSSTPDETLSPTTPVASPPAAGEGSSNAGRSEPPVSPGPTSHLQPIEGIAIGFNAPGNDTLFHHRKLEPISFPDLVLLEATSPLYISAPTYRALLRALAHFGTVRLEAPPSLIASVKTAIQTNAVVQFSRPNQQSNHWRCILHMEVHPSQQGGPASQGRNRAPSRIPARTNSLNTVVPLPQPCPPLPFTLSYLADYLRKALSDSRSASDHQGKALHRAVMQSDPEEAAKNASAPASRPGLLSVLGIGRNSTRTDLNEDTYDLVTPFILSDV